MKIVLWLGGHHDMRNGFKGSQREEGCEPRRGEPLHSLTPHLLLLSPSLTGGELAPCSRVLCACTTCSHTCAQKGEHASENSDGQHSDEPPS